MTVLKDCSCAVASKTLDVYTELVLPMKGCDNDYVVVTLAKSEVMGKLSEACP